MGVHYLVGGSGIPNYGDELIAKLWVDYITSLDSSKKIILDVKSVESSKRIVGDYESLEHVSILKSIAIRGQSKDLWENVKRGLNFIDNDGFNKYESMQIIKDLINQIETFHIFGGGYINNRWPAAAFYLGFAASLNIKFGTKIAATGLGLMPIRSPHKQEHFEILDKIIKCFSIFEVRDNDSFLAMNHPKIINGLDDVFLSDTPLLINDNLKRLHIVITFGESGYEKQKYLVDYIVNVLVPQYDEIIFWNCAPEKDHFSYEIFLQKVDNLKVYDVGYLVNSKFIFGKNDSMITTRFHPHLMASRAGLNGGFTIGNDYYDVKHSSIKSLGSEFFHISDNNLPIVFDSIKLNMRNLDVERVKAKKSIAHSIYG